MTAFVGLLLVVARYAKAHAGKPLLLLRPCRTLGHSQATIFIGNDSKGRPLINGVRAAHGHIAPRANRQEVVDTRCAPTTFGNIMAAMKIVNRHYIVAPPHDALGFVHTSAGLQPNLFA